MSDAGSRLVRSGSSSRALVLCGEFMCWLDGRILRRERNSFPRENEMDAMGLVVHRHYRNRAPAMQYLLGATDRLIREQELPGDTKLCVGMCRFSSSLSLTEVM
jgi:hypothetical protein